MKGNIGQLMKQAQAMQEGMRRVQEELATLEVEGQSGAGLVKITLTCKYDVKRVSIDPSLVGDDREMLEDLVAAAFNDASRRVEATVAERMGGLTAGMGLPPGLKKRGGDLPPGLEKQLRQKGHLPPGLEKKVQPFPVKLEETLPPLKPGLIRGVIEGRAIIFNSNTKLILDIFSIF